MDASLSLSLCSHFLPSVLYMYILTVTTLSFLSLFLLSCLAWALHPQPRSPKDLEVTSLTSIPYFFYSRSISLLLFPIF